MSITAFALVSIIKPTRESYANIVMTCVLLAAQFIRGMMVSHGAEKKVRAADGVSM